MLSHGCDKSLSTAVGHNDRGPVGLCYVTAPSIRLQGNGIQLMALTLSTGHEATVCFM